MIFTNFEIHRPLISIEVDQPQGSVLGTRRCLSRDREEVRVKLLSGDPVAQGRLSRSSLPNDEKRLDRDILQAGHNEIISPWVTHLS